MDVIDIKLPDWCTGCSDPLSRSREVCIVARYVDPERRTVVLAGYCTDCVRHDPELALLRTLTTPSRPDTP